MLERQIDTRLSIPMIGRARTRRGAPRSRSAASREPPSERQLSGRTGVRNFSDRRAGSVRCLPGSEQYPSAPSGGEASLSGLAATLATRDRGLANPQSSSRSRHLHATNHKTPYIETFEPRRPRAHSRPDTIFESNDSNLEECSERCNGKICLSLFASGFS